MREFLDGRIIAGKLFMQRKMEEFKSEVGASDMVTIILIILVVIAVAAIFKDRLTQLVGNLFDKMDAAVDNAGDL